MIHILETISMRRVLGSLVTFVTWAIVTLSAATAHADLVYSLNNYPDEQDGGTLVGSITVTDTAPDDGTLDILEVVAWNWTATNGPLSVSADTTEENAFFSPGGNGVTITETDILLANGSSLLLGVENASRQAGLFYSNIITVPSQFLAEEDFQFVWFSSPAADALGGDPWVIATIVPEPATITLLISALVAIGLMLVCRRSGAAR